MGQCVFDQGASLRRRGLSPPVRADAESIWLDAKIKPTDGEAIPRIKNWTTPSVIRGIASQSVGILVYSKMVTQMDPRITRQIEQHPYPLIFATISGAHLYGFPSPDSDYDLRGTHLLPLAEVIGIEHGPMTIEKSGIHEGLEIDLVTHDVGKFFGLLLKKNGYVLEQVFSPLVVQTSPAHDELKSIARNCITRHHVHHYLGFAATQWRLFQKESPPRVKPLLYVYRVLLTGIHLMQTGRIEANLRVLNEMARLPYVDELIARKLAGPEKGHLTETDLVLHEREYARLCGELKAASEASGLPEVPRGKAALHDLLVRLRLANGGRVVSPAGRREWKSPVN